ncbi:hypothetical protein, partial [Streptomyces sp. NPDC051776]|uniref:hypothetical protein n=1 Tax=Streptomyces sp. NPDC051776 TaxID=3155414 RepID=UPI00343E5C52
VSQRIGDRVQRVGQLAPGAASWANTTNGKLARRIDQASEQTIPAIAACPKDHGWNFFDAKD